MRRLVAVLVILFVGLAPAPIAQAQIGPDVPEPLTEQPAPPPPVNEFDDAGLSTLQKLLIFGAAALVLGAIAFVIVRDARRAAPPDERSRDSRAGGESSSGASGSAKAAREREREQRAKRARAKAARQQRKRNRPR